MNSLRAERAFWLRSLSELARAQGLAAQALKQLPTQDNSNSAFVRILRLQRIAIT